MRKDQKRTKSTGGRQPFNVGSEIGSKNLDTEHFRKFSLAEPIEYGAFKIHKTPEGLRWWIDHIKAMLQHPHSNKPVLQELLTRYKQHLQLYKRKPELWNK